MPRKKQQRPLLPPDPNFIWVQTKEGGFYRRKRGTVKEATLNTKLKEYQKAFSKISPVASRLKAWLEPYTYRLETGRLQGKLTAALVKSFLESGETQFTYLKDFEFQKEFPFSKHHGNFPVKIKDDAVEIQLPVYNYSVDKQSPIVTAYYYELIVIGGDPMKDGPVFRDSVTSPVFEFEKTYGECVMEIDLPGNGLPWMVMLKLHTIELGSEMAVHPRHYAMRVVAVGG
jgi:hypothetical protein